MQIVVGLACDHAGYALKVKVKKHLLTKGIKVNDFGTDSEESCDYADFAHQLAKSVNNNESNVGLAFCGSGNGINITLNRHKNVRSAYCWLKEIALLARKHNNANICTIPARFITESHAIEIIEAFLSADFEGGRHQKRIEKIEIIQLCH